MLIQPVPRANSAREECRSRTGGELAKRKNQSHGHGIDFCFGVCDSGNMRILITIQDKKIKLALLDGKKKLDSWLIEDEHRLSEELLLRIDKMLKKNKFKPEDIGKIEVETDQTDSFTTTRIAKTTADAWNWTIKK